jgi:transcriptional regulator with XRE-family HTH domain
MSRMRYTSIKSAEALGSAVKHRRIERKLSQVALAQLMGVERKWVVRLEAGNHAAEIGNVLKVIQILELDLRLFYLKGQSPTLTASVTPRASEVFEQLSRDQGKKR